MIWYIILVLFLILIFICCRSRKRALVLSFLSLWIFSSIRGEGIGADYDAYLNYFDIYSSWGWIEALNWGQEIGYVWLNKFVSLIGGSYQQLLAICSFLSLIGVFYFINKNSDNIGFSILLYVFFAFYQCTFTRLRQSIAISFVLIAYCHCQDKKLFKFLLMIFVASCFHKTAAIALVVYPLMNKKINKTLIVLFACVLFLFIFARPFMTPLVNKIVSVLGFGNYEDYGSGQGGMLTFIYIICLIYIFYIRSKSYRSNVSLDNFNISSMEMNLMFAMLAVFFQSLALYISLFNRVADFFTIPMIILIPNSFLFVNNNNKGFVKSFVFLTSFAFYLYLLYIGVSSTVPYIFYWR